MRGAPAFLLLALAPAGWPQAELTLDEAVRTALQNNRQVRIAQLEVRKSEAAIAAARTYRLPGARVGLLAAQPLTHLDFHFPPGSLGTYPATGPIPFTDAFIRNPLTPLALVLAGVDQPISQLHRIGLAVDLQTLKREEASQKLEQQEQAVANDVKKTYYGLLQAQSALDATGDALKLFRELERVAQQGLIEQVVLQGDVLDVQMRLAQTELEQVTLRNTIETQKGALNILLGRPLETDFRAASLPQAAALEIDPAAARSRALAQRPEREEARIHLLEAEKDARLKKAEYIPDVSLSLNYLGLGNIKFVPANTVMAGVLVNWNIFDWGRKKHELAAKEDGIQQAKEALAETEEKIQLEVDHNRRKLEESRARLRVSDLARRAAIEKLRVSTNKWQEGAIQVKDLLQGQTSVAEANYQYQKDLAAFWTAKAEFDKALGEK